MPPTEFNREAVDRRPHSRRDRCLRQQLRASAGVFFRPNSPRRRRQSPSWIRFNEALASELGVDAQGLESDELAAVFAGNVTPPAAAPIAMAYAGHQFGSFVPQLGDGRAILLGEVWTATASGAMSN